MTWASRRLSKRAAWIPCAAGSSYADRYIMRDGPQEWQLFFYKGFRYVQLTLRDCPGPVEVECANAVFTSYPVQYPRPVRVLRSASESDLGCGPLDVAAVHA